MAPAAAQAAPRLSAASPVDADRDGKVDGFTLRFSERVIGSLKARDVSVKGYRVVAARRPRGSSVVVNVSEGSTCDLGVQPRVAIRSQRGLTSAKKRPIRAGSLDLERRDRRAPRLTCAMTADRDRNGRIDAIDLTFSKPVRSKLGRGLRGALGVDRYSIASAQPIRGRFLRLTLVERPSEDSGTVPGVSYRRPAGRKNKNRGLSGRGGPVKTFASGSTRDGAPPRMMGSSTRDDNGDGRLDRIEVRYSEPVRPTAGQARSAGGGAAVTLPAPPGLGTADRPVWSAGGGDVSDLAGNPAPAASQAASDGAGPVLLAASTADRGGVRGAIDGVDLTFSEPVVKRGGGASSVSVAGYGVTGASAAGVRASVAVAETGALDGGQRPAVGYARGTPDSFSDAAGNEAVPAALGDAVDGVAPQLIGATTRDRDGDGRLDRVEYLFSEPVAAVPGACGACGLGADGRTVTGLTAVASATLGLDLAEGAFDTGARLQARLNPLLGGGVTDGAGNAPLAASLLAADGARPALISSATDDSDADGRIDGLDLGFSEPVTSPATGGPDTPFSVAGYSLSGATAANAQTTLRVGLVELGGPDTGAAPDAAYTGNGPAVRDAAGLPPVTGRQRGLTRDAVAPRVMDVATVDGDRNGHIDSIEITYSEPLRGAALASSFSSPGRTVAGDPDLSGPLLRVPLEEASDFDTDATPTLSYLPVAGSVTDVPAGPGDGADTVPGLAAKTPRDAAAPALVHATTQETGTPDGFVDRVDGTFSEPIVYSPGDVPGVTASGLTIASVQPASSGPTPSRRLLLAATKATKPNSGLLPNIVAAPTRVRDLVGNDANGPAFAADIDEVRPVVIDARLGNEAAGTGCPVEPNPNGNGSADCVRASWSEVVDNGGAAIGNFSLDGQPVTGGFLATDEPTASDFPLANVVDRSATTLGVSYAEQPGPPVKDAQGNAGLPTSTTIDVEPACDDPEEGSDDARSNANPLFSTGGHRLCARDSDWYRLGGLAPGPVTIGVQPGTGLTTEVKVVQVRGGDVSTVATSEANAPAARDVVGFTAIAGAAYWVEIRDDTGAEGTYCTLPNYEPGTSTCDGGTGPGGSEN